MKKIALLTLLTMLNGVVFSQGNIPFKAKYFKGQKKELKEAVKSIKAGDKIMTAKGVVVIEDALVEYEKAQTFNPNNAELNYKIGVCYLETDKKFSALERFEKAYSLDSKLDHYLFYYLGVGYQLEMEWDEAIKNYNKFKSELSRNYDPEGANEVAKRINECEYGKTYSKREPNFEIILLDDGINSKYSDYSMVFDADSTNQYFISRRPSGFSQEIDVDGGFYENIFSVSNEDVSTLKNVGAPLNSPKTHIGVVTFHPLEDKIIIFRDDNGDGNLYESVRTDEKWSEPVLLNGGINSEFHETSAWYSPDGQELYFVSERPYAEQLKKTAKKKKEEEAYEKNIYVAKWNKSTNSWEDITKLPSTVNTSYDEDGVYMHPDGKTLYFSSKGHTSMGGYDVFKTEKLGENKWSKAENLGYPVNTADNDVFFILTEDYQSGYLTSHRKNGIGGNDIYRVKAIAPTPEEVFVEVKMTVVDKNTGVPLSDAAVEIMNIETGEKETVSIMDGMFVATLSSDVQYEIKAKGGEYVTLSKNYTFSEKDQTNENNLTIGLEKVVVDETDLKQVAEIENIYFDLNSSYLRSDAIVSLDKIVRIMNDNPSMQIEIGAHTDCRESNNYNQWLSERRAKRSADYIADRVGNGSSRITYVGYGETKLVNSCGCDEVDDSGCSEDQHQTNRRVEFIVKGN